MWIYIIFSFAVILAILLGGYVLLRRLMKERKGGKKAITSNFVGIFLFVLGGLLLFWSRLDYNIIFQIGVLFCLVGFIPLLISFIHSKTSLLNEKKTRSLNSIFGTLASVLLILAILGFLMFTVSVMYNPSHPTSFSDKAEMILRKASSDPGVTKVSSGEIPLEEGEIYTKDAFNSATGGEKVIYEGCNGVIGVICEVDSKGYMEIKEDAKAKISACCYPDENCKIGIGTTVMCN